MQGIMDQNNSEYGHFLRSVYEMLIIHKSSITYIFICFQEILELCLCFHWHKNFIDINSKENLFCDWGFPIFQKSLEAFQKENEVLINIIIQGTLS